MKALQFLLLASLICLIGCAPGSVDDRTAEDGQQVGPESSQANDAPVANEPEADVTLDILPLDAITEQIKSSGKLTVVDVWSTQCVPCMQEFHGLVELHNELGDKIHCVSINVDFIGGKSNPPESYRDEVLAFLKSQKATNTNFLSATSDRDVFGQLDLSSIPAVIVYNADGTVARRFVDEADSTVSYEAIKPFVRQLAASL